MSYKQHTQYFRTDISTWFLHVHLLKIILSFLSKYHPPTLFNPPPPPPIQFFILSKSLFLKKKHTQFCVGNEVSYGLFCGFFEAWVTNCFYIYVYTGMVLVPGCEPHRKPQKFLDIPPFKLMSAQKISREVSECF